MAKKSDEMSMIGHLEELRRVLVVSIVGTTVFAIAAFFFVDQILAALTFPLKQLGQKVVFIALLRPSW